jgi:hypothetical protein
MVAPNTPTKYRGTDVYLANIVTRDRRPTGADYRQPETGRLYPIFAGWQVGKDPTTGVEGELWLLTKIVANVAYWELLNGSGSGTVVSLTGDDTVVVNPDVSGNINVFGETVANATNAKPVFTTSFAANTENIEVQLATTVTPTPGSNVNVGLACFNTNQFTMDATSGMVSLKGGSVNPPLLTATGDDAVAVSPSGTGNINFLGNTVANATHAKPLYVLNSAANTERFDIQIATITAPTPVNSNKCGIACFNNMQFSIDATSGMVSAIGSLTDLHVARYIVSAGGTTDGANYTTIASAYAAAVAAGAPQTVFVQPGTYTEDLTLTAGINISGFSCDAASKTAGVLIVGKISYSQVGNVGLSGLILETNGDYAIEVTGANASVLRLVNCFLYAHDNNGIHYTSSSGNSKIEFYACKGDVSATFAYFTHSSAGKLAFYNSVFENNGGTTAASTCSAGTVNLLNCYFNNAITTSSTGGFIASDTEFHGPLIANGTGAAQTGLNCSFFGGTNAAISVGTGATYSVANCAIQSTNGTSAIAGAGTIEWSNISFTDTQTKINTTTQVPIQSGNNAEIVSIPGAYPYTVKPQEFSIPVSTSSARTINLPAAPTTGEKHLIIDDTGSAGANNITVQGNGNNINGAASKTINSNYGSLLVVFNGTQWNAK